MKLHRPGKWRHSRRRSHGFEDRDERQGLQRGEAEEALAAMRRATAAAQGKRGGEEQQEADAAAEAALQEIMENMEDGERFPPPDDGT